MSNTKHSTRPDDSTLIRSYVETKPGTLTNTHTAVFEYPECIRTFDGDTWKVWPKIQSTDSLELKEQSLKDYLIGKGVIK
jgi:hypothetical protein